MIPKEVTESVIKLGISIEEFNAWVELAKASQKFVNDDERLSIMAHNQYLKNKKR